MLSAWMVFRMLRQTISVHRGQSSAMTRTWDKRRWGTCCPLQSVDGRAFGFGPRVAVEGSQVPRLCTCLTRVIPKGFVPSPFATKLSLCLWRWRPASDDGWKRPSSHRAVGLTKCGNSSPAFGHQLAMLHVVWTCAACPRATRFASNVGTRNTKQDKESVQDVKYAIALSVTPAPRRVHHRVVPGR